MKYFIELDFIGKDSVPYRQKVEIDPIVWAEIQKIQKEKNPNDHLFDIGSGEVNDFLKKISPQCTPKSLRTIKANETFVEELRKQKVSIDDTDAAKLRALFNANLAVAKTLNHQKNVGKNQKEQETKAKDRVVASKNRIKEIEEKGKIKIKALKEELKAHEALWTGEKLKAKRANIKERKEKIEAQMARAIAAAEKAELNFDKKKMTKDVALGTSLAAYVDARILYSWCETFQLPVERVYTDSARKNFDWADGCDPDFWKKYPNV